LDDNFFEDFNINYTLYNEIRKNAPDLTKYWLETSGV